MKLGHLLGGYRTSLKRKLGKRYQKWLDMCHEANISANQRMEELVLADLKHGIIDLDAVGGGQALKKKELIKASENIGMLGAITELTNQLAAARVENANIQMQTLQELGVNPLQQQLQELQELKAGREQELQQQEALYRELTAEIKKQRAILDDTREAREQAEAELRAIQAAKLEEQAKGVQYIPQSTNNVPSGEKTNGEVHIERDSKGRYKKGSQARVQEASQKRKI